MPCVCCYSDHPEKQLDFLVSRGEEIIHIPVTPALSADGGGRIGVSLAPNAKIVRKVASSAAEAVKMASSEFGRLFNTVTGGACLSVIVLM
jgi:hypothetical protein